MNQSYISKKELSPGESVRGADIREGIFNLIASYHPGFNSDLCISLEELNHFRRLYLTRLIEGERGELAQIDQDVMRAIRENTLLSEKVKEEMDKNLTLGQRLADRIASFGGSWTFIILFFAFLFAWMALNFFWLANNGFDPYPFILLNLILSCLAAIQAPIIMMSQNRQEQKDRQRAEHDYKINLKAEIEIQILSEKIDHLLVHQNRKLLEIQEVQVDYLEDLIKLMEKR